MNEKQINLQVAKANNEILRRRSIGLKARIEGVTAHIAHKNNPLTPENISSYTKELDLILQDSKDLVKEYEEFALWVKQNVDETLIL